ncbi:hypothetical protein HCA58_05835 [Micromonospora sp. HNM0581]|uniref:hypothetical protein n=1 Tax=Micromonospora sp. HNM0581 TaxID=2716341 RepID=UPI00146AC608|nr:hypothetical protein [Micromonospora sp. HNM0581]NLU77923.1 hypothetical protein [Micromonospora sp. HNM0581]
MRLLHHMSAAVADNLGRAAGGADVPAVPAPRTVSRYPLVDFRGASIVTVRRQTVSRCFYHLGLSPSVDDDRAPPYRALRRGGIPVSVAGRNADDPPGQPGRVVDLEEADKAVWRQCM